MNPKVSVITGYYNRSAYLRRTIESILRQSFTDWELLIFDDFSTDNTRDELIRLLTEFNDPRIVPIFHKENLGFVTGMIQAVKQAKGTYIAVQGSGDISLPKRLELQSELLDINPEIGVVAGPYFYVEENGLSKRLVTQKPSNLTFNEMLKGVDFTHGEVMYRKSVYNQVGGYRPEFTFGQDYELWLRMSKVTKFATLSEPIYVRYGLTDGASYKPQKFVQQRLLSELARKLAVMPLEKQTETLALLKSGGPEIVVPISTPEIQKRLVRGSIRMITLGAHTSGREVALRYIDSLFWKHLITSLASFYSKSWFRPFRFFIQTVLGINRKTG